MKLKKIKSGMVVRCNTIEDAKKLIKRAYECGFKWNNSPQNESNWSYSSYTLYHFYEDKSIYYSYNVDNLQVIEFSDLIINEEDELSAAEAIQLQSEMCGNCDTYQCLFKEKYSEKISISCDDWKLNHPKEVIECLKQYKKDTAVDSHSKPEIEWHYRVFSLDYSEDKITEQEAIDRCEELARDGHSTWYNKVCMQKE